MNWIGLIFALLFFMVGCALGALHSRKMWSGWITVWPKRADLHWRDALTASEWTANAPGKVGPYRVVAMTEQKARDEILRSFYDGMDIQYRNDFIVEVNAEEMRS